MLKILLFIILIIPNAMAETKYKKNLKNLTDIQEYVTQHSGTEPAFNNKYWDNKEPGIYVDVTTGEPLFSSLDKFDSGTGWPSFTKPINQEIVSEHQDYSHGMSRIEVKASKSDAHLGHVFNDGPRDKGGMRYCINSASLRFIHKDDLAKEGYAEYLALFGEEVLEAEANIEKSEVALLAGGCFWGMEELFRKLPGVINTEVGYSGGTLNDPAYELVSKGIGGHAETLKVVFDPQKISYADIVKFFFKIHDPTTLNQQGNDIGVQYRSAIFYQNEQQKKTAEQVKNLANEAGFYKGKVVTEITPAGEFYAAEDYHQDYLQKNPRGYTCHFIRPIEL